MKKRSTGDVAVIATFRSGLEADIAVARLRGAGVPAQARGNDISGVFGFGFQGPTSRGVDVLVPASFAAKARGILGIPLPDPRAT